MSAQILVVGAGPVGLTAALELARYGVSVRIVERLPERSDKSKALAVWARTLELMDRAGAGAALVAAGNKVNGTKMFCGGKQLGQVTLADLAGPHPYVLLIAQDETERVLEERLNALGVRVERGVEMTAFAQTNDGVTVTLAHAGDAPETLDVAWLVACDGAHSPVRHALGKPFDGTTVTTDFILADVHLADAPGVARSWISMFAHADGGVQLFPIRGDRFRVIADLGDATDEHRAEPTLDEVQAIVERRGPGGITLRDPIWLSSFRINERQVADYRSGRIFLAGDAAHVHSPVGGQGMNTGMQDACNLAWKLAFVVSDACDARLLESYNAERRPVAHQLIAQTSTLTALMTAKNPLVQSIRNCAISWTLGIPAVRHALADKLSEITIGYPDSPLSHRSARPLPGPHAGERAPQFAGDPPAGASSGPRFTLCAEPSDAGRAFVRAYESLVAGELQRPFAAGAMWLVRPDGYVGVAAPAGDWPTLRAYLDTVTGRNPLPISSGG